MNKKVIIAAASVLGALLIAGLVYLGLNLRHERQEKAELEALAAMDKREMENEYKEFALQYDELKRSIRNDSLLQRLTEEEQKVSELREELKRTKSNDAREIQRLKKELATVRAVLRSYVLQVDSLNRLNESLHRENEAVRQQYQAATEQVSALSSEKQNLTEKVAIAAQLDATSVSILPQNKRGKDAKRVKDITRFTISFTISKNITAQTGERQVCVRLLKPNGEVLSQQGSVAFENTQVGISAQRVIEYTGEEQRVTVYIPVNEYIGAGTFRVQIIADKHLIGSGSITIDK
jgi:NurA-like 5'-3' nuclease